MTGDRVSVAHPARTAWTLSAGRADTRISAIMRDADPGKAEIYKHSASC